MPSKTSVGTDESQWFSFIIRFPFTILPKHHPAQPNTSINMYFSLIFGAPCVCTSHKNVPECKTSLFKLVRTIVFDLLRKSPRAWTERRTRLRSPRVRVALHSGSTRAHAQHVLWELHRAYPRRSSLVFMCLDSGTYRATWMCNWLPSVPCTCGIPALSARAIPIRAECKGIQVSFYPHVDLMQTQGKRPTMYYEKERRKERRRGQ